MSRTWKTLIFWLLVTCLGEPRYARAITVQVLPGESPVLIQGTVGEEASFTKKIGLISSDAIAELILRPGDLQRDHGGETISRQQIAPSSVGKFQLPKNIPQDFEIKVAGVKVPGTYQGQLHFILPETGMKSVLDLPIKVIANGVPKLTQRKSSASVKLQLVNCSRFGRFVSRPFQPYAFATSYPLQFDNASLAPFDIDASIIGIGDLSRSSLGQNLQVKSKETVLTDAVFTLPITIQQPVGLAPDHYVGDVILRLPDQSAPTQIPVEINVRAGPIVPAIVLLAGIFLGRLIKYMKDKGGPQSDLLLSLYRIEVRIALSPDDQNILQDQLEKAKTSIYDMRFDQAKEQLDAIEKQWTLLKTLRSLERTLQPRAASDPLVQPILSRIQDARNIVRLGTDASATVTQIQTDVQALSAQPHPAGVMVGPEVADAYSLASAQAETARVAAGRAAGPAPLLQPRLVRALWWLTGVSGAFRAEATLWLIRPVMYILLIIGLGIVGLQQLYLKNPTFGSDPLNDYFGIVLWAISSDIASRTLSTLKS